MATYKSLICRSGTTALKRTACFVGLVLVTCDTGHGVRAQFGAVVEASAVILTSVSKCCMWLATSPRLPQRRKSVIGYLLIAGAKLNLVGISVSCMWILLNMLCAYSVFGIWLFSGPRPSRATNIKPCAPPEKIRRPLQSLMIFLMRTERVSAIFFRCLAGAYLMQG